MKKIYLAELENSLKYFYRAFGNTEKEAVDALKKGIEQEAPDLSRYEIIVNAHIIGVAYCDYEPMIEEK